MRLGQRNRIREPPKKTKRKLRVLKTQIEGPAQSRQRRSSSGRFRQPRRSLKEASRTCCCRQAYSQYCWDWFSWCSNDIIHNQLFTQYWPLFCPVMPARCPTRVLYSKSLQSELILSSQGKLPQAILFSWRLMRSGHTATSNCASIPLIRGAYPNH